MDKKRRSTAQKRLIEELLLGSSGHITAEQLHLLARESLPKISIGTVYRNLRRLVKEGRAFELKGPEGKLLFEGAKEAHHHLRCLNCKSIVDVEVGGDLLSEIAKKVSRESGFLIKDLSLEIAGFCPLCQGRLASEAAKEKQE